MDWCVRDRAQANHPPVVKLAGERVRKVRPGERLTLDASASTDPDGDKLSFAWLAYPEPSGYADPLPAIGGDDTARASLVVPAAERLASLHVILSVTDNGTPPLTRYARVVLDITPQ
jgi:hypothetical protein